jgi:hypothetical protein
MNGLVAAVVFLTTVVVAVMRAPSLRPKRRRWAAAGVGRA